MQYFINGFTLLIGRLEGCYLDRRPANIPHVRRSPGCNNLWCFGRRGFWPSLEHCPAIRTDWILHVRYLLLPSPMAVLVLLNRSFRSFWKLTTHRKSVQFFLVRLGVHLRGTAFGGFQLLHPATGGPPAASRNPRCNATTACTRREKPSCKCLLPSYPYR